MHFFEQSKRLAGEFLKFKKYKNMAPVLAVFVGIFLIPFALFFFLGLGMLFLSCMLFYLLESPLNYLHGVVKTEGKETHPATCFIIYFISWPLIFLLYVSYAFLTFFIHAFYLGTTIAGYIASLGGFKFHITPNEQDIEVKNTPKGPFNIVALVYILIVAVLILITIVIAVSTYNNLYYYSREAHFWYQFYPTLIAMFELYSLFTIIYVPIAFRFRGEPELLPEPEPEPKPEEE